MADIVIQSLTKKFGAVTALDRISFDVSDGEFVSLLGPSGCGKSTTLGALAGLEQPTSGLIKIGNQTVFDSTSGVYIDAEFRNLGLMFQSYALWPHMSVAENLNFPLKVRKVTGETAKRKINEALEIVQMAEYANRFPGELSGGQQQRVALARTLVYEPKVLLLDEPLSNLDAKLRDQARIWLRDLQQKTGVTTLYVTHDQSEALALSDRIIVMDKGRIAQIGTPSEIYDTPSSVFVADFVGNANLLEATIVSESREECTVSLQNGSTLITPGRLKASSSSKATISIRPERIQLISGKASKATNNCLRADRIYSSYQGSRFTHFLKVGNTTIRAETSGELQSDLVNIVLPSEALTLF